MIHLPFLYVDLCETNRAKTKEKEMNSELYRMSNIFLPSNLDFA